MTQFLIRRFIRHPNDPQDPATRTAYGNVVSLIGFRLAAKAPDDEHPYGHARYEYLAGLVVSVTILGIGFSLLKESVVKVFHPTPVAFSWLSVGVLAASASASALRP